ncbi:hypothetical protein [Burkholderia pyrrocinia]|uniref:hypothetical protein n=1 Tax=Burkholderia pyrrocinia TaxID=60550 RepID=UPI00158EDB19|nr:hypothetical protein [Burkholderia pyrrocinia]
MEGLDLLNELIVGKLSAEEAESTCDFYLENLTANDPPIIEMLSISRKERMAYAHGAPFEVIAQWRGNGWPDKCFLCGGKIVPENFGWLPREHDGKIQLRHVVCPKD